MLLLIFQRPFSSLVVSVTHASCIKTLRGGYFRLLLIFSAKCLTNNGFIANFVFQLFFKFFLQLWLLEIH